MKYTLILLVLIVTACQNKTGNAVTINIDKGHGSVNIMGLPLYTLHGIKADTLNIEAWQSLLPVCAMPADTDMRNYQEPIKGKYAITESAISFTPDTPFKAGQTYFARYYRYDEQLSTIDLITHHRTPGKANYTELIFKY